MSEKNLMEATVKALSVDSIINMYADNPALPVELLHAKLSLVYSDAIRINGEADRINSDVRKLNELCLNLNLDTVDEFNDNNFIKGTKSKSKTEKSVSESNATSRDAYTYNPSTNTYYIAE